MEKTFEIGSFIGEGQDGVVHLLREHTGSVYKRWKPTFLPHLRRQECAYHEACFRVLPDGLVPKIHNIITEEGVLRGFTMDFMPGTPIGALLQAHKAIADPSFVYQVKGIVEEIWKTAGIAHGDPHLWNLLIDEPHMEHDPEQNCSVLYDGIIRVIDFGRSSSLPRQHQLDMQRIDQEFAKFHRIRSVPPPASLSGRIAT